VKYGSEASLDADLTYVMNQSTDEAWRRDPRLSFRPPQRRTPGWRTSSAGPALFGVLLARTKMLRIPLSVVFD